MKSIDSSLLDRLVSERLNSRNINDLGEIDEIDELDDSHFSLGYKKAEHKCSAFILSN